MLTIALLAAVDPGTPSLDLPTITGVVTSLGVTGCLIVGIYWLVTGRLAPKSVIDRMQTQIDAKDAALQRKDEQIQKLNDQNQALNKGLLDTAVPALARAALILEKYHTDTTVRRSE